MKRLLELLGVVRLVWTQDHDGEIRLRVVRGLPTRAWCASILASNPVFLHSDGSASGAVYVDKWWPYNKRSPQVVKEEWPDYVSMF